MDFVATYTNLFLSTFSDDVPHIIWILSGLLIVMFVIYTLILAYHLIRYGIGSYIYVPFFIGYIIFSLILIGIMSIAATMLI